MKSLFASCFLRCELATPIPTSPAPLAELRSHHKLPYTDCFAAALAALRKASLATSDQDFAALEKKIDILWTTV